MAHFPNLYRNLFEQRHVFNYFGQDFEHDSNADFAEKIYNFFRHELIKKLNDASMHGINIDNQPIEFELPRELRKFSRGRTLKLLKLFYFKKASSVKMQTLKTDENIDELTIQIFVDLFDKDFKPYFFHELKHYIQLSFNYKIFNDQFRTENNLVKQIQLLVNRFNPIESSAYMEQIYNKAYWRRWNTQDTANQIAISLEKEYSCDEDTFQHLKSLIKSNQEEFDYYVAFLFLSNAPEFSKDKEYRLFNQNDYEKPYYKEIRHTFNIELYDEASIVLSLRQNAEKLTKNKDMIDRLRKLFLFNLNYYRQGFVNYLISVVGMAVDDADYNKSHDWRTINNEGFQNYIRKDFETDKIIVEAIIKDKDIDRFSYIAEIKGESIVECLMKYIYIKETYADDFSIEFGFKDVFDQAVRRVSVKLDEYVTEEYSSILKIQSIIDEVNDIDMF